MSRLLPIGLIVFVLLADVKYFARAQEEGPPETPPCDNGCVEAVWMWSGGGQATVFQKYYHEAGQGMVLWAPVISGAVYCYDESPAPIDYHPTCSQGARVCFIRRDNGNPIFGFEGQVTGVGQCNDDVLQIDYCDCSGEEN